MFWMYGIGRNGTHVVDVDAHLKMQISIRVDEFCQSPVLIRQHVMLAALVLLRSYLNGLTFPSPIFTRRSSHLQFHCQVNTAPVHKWSAVQRYLCNGVALVSSMGPSHVMAVTSAVQTLQLHCMT